MFISIKYAIKNIYVSYGLLYTWTHKYVYG